MGYNSAFSVSDSTSPATVTSSSGTAIVSFNANRQSVTIQNYSTNPVYIQFATDCTTEAFNCILSPDYSVASGNGGILEIDNYIGSIYGLAPEGEGLVSIVETEL